MNIVIYNHESYETNFGNIYIVECSLNKLLYVGQTVNKIEKRWKKHIIAANKKYDNTYFHNAIRKYGEDKFNVYVIPLKISSKEELNLLEEEFIKLYQTTDRKSTR